MSTMRVFLYKTAAAGVLFLSAICSATQNPIPSGFDSVSTIWKASPITANCVGFSDGFGRSWADPLFNESAWSTIRPPDIGSFNTPGLGPADRFYRGTFTLTSVAQPVSLFFVSDDGIEIFVNGTSIGSFHPFSSNICHVLGCVNIPGCGQGFNVNVAPVPIPVALLRLGTNVIAAHVSNGGGGSYFDLDVLTTPGGRACQTKLAVDSFNQGDPLWNPPLHPQPYDFLTNPPVTDLPAGISALYIKDEGCFLTSLAMALRFAGATTIPGPVPQTLNPGTLNDLFETKSVYSSGQIVADTGNIDPVKAVAIGADASLRLKFDPTSAPGSSNPQDLDSILCAANPVPVIVQVGTMRVKDGVCTVSGQFTGHYVLVTGKAIDSSGIPHYLINDPGCRHFTSLDSYDNKFKIRGVVHDPPDNLSNLNIFVERTADIAVVDALNRRTGLDPATGLIVQQIPDSGYFVDEISNDTTEALDLGKTYSVQILRPQESDYDVNVMGIQLGVFTVSLDAIAADGSVQPRVLVRGIGGPGSTSAFRLRFTAVSGAISKITVVASFQSTLADIANALSLSLIDNPGIANSLANKIHAASSALTDGEINSALQSLNAFEHELNAQAGKHVDETASEILRSDVNALVEQLSLRITSF